MTKRMKNNQIIISPGTAIVATARSLIKYYKKTKKNKDTIGLKFCLAQAE